MEGNPRESCCHAEGFLRASVKFKPCELVVSCLPSLAVGFPLIADHKKITKFTGDRALLYLSRKRESLNAKLELRVNFLELESRKTSHDVNIMVT